MTWVSKIKMFVHGISFCYLFETWIQTNISKCLIILWISQSQIFVSGISLGYLHSIPLRAPGPATLGALLPLRWSLTQQCADCADHWLSTVTGKATSSVRSRQKARRPIVSCQFMTAWRRTWSWPSYETKLERWSVGMMSSRISSRRLLSLSEVAENYQSKLS